MGVINSRTVGKAPTFTAEQEQELLDQGRFTYMYQSEDEWFSIPLSSDYTVHMLNKGVLHSYLIADVISLCVYTDDAIIIKPLRKDVGYAVTDSSGSVVSMSRISNLATQVTAVTANTPEVAAAIVFDSGISGMSSGISVTSNVITVTLNVPVLDEQGRRFAQVVLPDNVKIIPTTVALLADSLPAVVSINSFGELYLESAGLTKLTGSFQLIYTLDKVPIVLDSVLNLNGSRTIDNVTLSSGVLVELSGTQYIDSNITLVDTEVTIIAVLDGSLSSSGCDGLEYGITTNNEVYVTINGVQNVFARAVVGEGIFTITYDGSSLSVFEGVTLLGETTLTGILACEKSFLIGAVNGTNGIAQSQLASFGDVLVFNSVLSTDERTDVLRNIELYVKTDKDYPTLVHPVSAVLISGVVKSGGLVEQTKTTLANRNVKLVSLLRSVSGAGNTVDVTEDSHIVHIETSTGVTYRPLLQAEVTDVSLPYVITLTINSDSSFVIKQITNQAQTANINLDVVAGLNVFTLEPMIPASDGFKLLIDGSVYTSFNATVTWDIRQYNNGGVAIEGYVSNAVVTNSVFGTQSDLINTSPVGKLLGVSYND